MKEIKKKKKPPTMYDILHHFANQIKNSKGEIKEKNRVAYYDGDTLYYHKQAVAQIYSYKKKIVLIKNIYNNGWGMGRSLDSNRIKFSFSDKWKLIVIPNNSSLCNENSSQDIKNDTFKYIINNYIERIVESWTILLRNIDGKKLYDNRSLECINRYIKDYYNIAKILHIPKDLLDVKYYKYSVHWEEYNGWISHSFSTTINNTPKYWLNIHLSKKQKEILDRKNWLFKWMYGKCKLPNQRRLDIYNDVNKRIAWETAKKDEEVERLRLQAEKQRERDEVEKKDQLVKLEFWLKGENIGNLWSVPVHLRILKTKEYKFVKSKLSEGTTKTSKEKHVILVETTKGATVPLEHARLLYLKFKQCIKTNTIWKPNGKSIMIGVYKIEYIGNETHSRFDKVPTIIYGDWYIKAGCHYIYEAQIDDFVKRNNLNW